MEAAAPAAGSAQDTEKAEEAEGGAAAGSPPREGWPDAGAEAAEDADAPPARGVSGWAQCQARRRSGAAPGAPRV
jgi:hypothetical protein